MKKKTGGSQGEDEQEEEQGPKSVSLSPLENNIENGCRTYSAEEKVAYVRQVLEKGRSRSEVAKEFGIPYRTLYAWVKKAQQTSASGSQKEGKESSIVQDKDQDQTVPTIDVGNKKQVSPPAPTTTR